MKMKGSLCLVLLCLAGLRPPAASAHAVVGDLMLMVKERSDSEKAAKYTYRQNIALEITISGKPHNPETRIVKWTVYGKDRKTDAVSILKSGDARVDFALGSTQKIITEEVSTTSSADHTVSSSSRGGRGNSRRLRYTKVEGSGTRYIGYGVQVFEGDKVVAEKFDPRTLESKP